MYIEIYILGFFVFVLVQMMNTFDGEKIVLTVNCNTLVENFLILDFFKYIHV